MEFVHLHIKLLNYLEFMARGIFNNPKAFRKTRAKLLLLIYLRGSGWDDAADECFEKMLYEEKVGMIEIANNSFWKREAISFFTTFVEPEETKKEDILKLKKIYESEGGKELFSYEWQEYMGEVK